MLDVLGRMEVCLAHPWRAGLAAEDCATLAPRFEKLSRYAASVVAPSRDLVSEMGTTAGSPAVRQSGPTRFDTVRCHHTAIGGAGFISHRNILPTGRLAKDI